MAEWAVNQEITVALANQKMVYVGEAVPATVYEGQIWIDISTDPPTVKSYDITNTSWSQYSMIYYETQAGAWANPAQTPVTNGTIVILYNSTQLATRLYMYSNNAWTYIATGIPRIYTLKDDSAEGTFARGGLGAPYARTLAVGAGTEVTIASCTVTPTRATSTIIAWAGSTNAMDLTNTGWKLYIDSTQVDTEILGGAGWGERNLLGALDNQTAALHTIYVKTYNDDGVGRSYYSFGTGVGAYAVVV